MPGSTIQTFANPYDYQASVRAADLTVVVAARGEFKAQLTRIDLHRLWMQRSEMSLPSVTHSAVHKNRNPILFLADAQQRPMAHSGIEISAGDIVFNSSGAEHHHRTPANCLWGAMSLTPEDLATYGRALAGRELTAPAATRVITRTTIIQLRAILMKASFTQLPNVSPTGHPEALEQAMVHAVVGLLMNLSTRSKTIVPKMTTTLPIM